MFVQILFGFIAVLFALYYYFTRTFNYWKNKNVKGPKPIVLFGNLLDTTLRKEPFSHALKRVYDEFPNERFVGMYRLTNPTIVIRDLDLIKQVMIKDFDKFDDRGEYSKKGLGENLFHVEGETWQVLRNRFTPLFTSGKLKNMLHLITEQGDKFLDYVQDITNKESEQPVHNLVKLYTVATISACAFGLDIDLTDENGEIVSKLNEVDRMIFYRNFFYEIDMMYPGLFKALGLPLTPNNLTYFFKNLVTGIVKERNGMPSNRNDFMDLLLKLKNEGDIIGSKRSEKSKEFTLKVTDDVMAAQAFVFYGAGYETSATTMAFMLYELARNPHVQDKLCEEVDEVLEKSNNVVTYDTLEQLPYMEKVFNETLRLYPLGDPLSRNVTKGDYTIPGTDVVLEKRTTVLVSVMGIHHDEKLYPKPKEFDPERFDPKVAAERHPCAFMPFGIGPRNCIGMRFAKIQSRVCMVKLLSHFRVELVPSEKEMAFDSTRVILSPTENYKLKFVPRKKVN